MRQRWIRWRIARISDRIARRQRELRLLRYVAFELQLQVEGQRLAQQITGYVEELEKHHG